MLFVAFVLPGTNTRSGMKAPNGTFMKRLLSTSQTEHSALRLGDSAPPRLTTAREATVANAPMTFFID